MKRWGCFCMLLALACASLGAQEAKKEKGAAQCASQTINSTTEANGNQHPGSGAVAGACSVTCASANGSNASQYPPSCSTAAPGYSGIVNVHQTIGTSGAGTVSLTCNGQAPLSCSAQIH